jgi:hypothetical protein
MNTKSLIIGLLVVVASGCAENRSSFFIRQVLVPEEGECSVDATDTTKGRTRGLLDIAFSHNYALPILLSNQLTARASAGDFVTETNGIQVSGANVRIWLGGVAEGTPWGFYQPTSGYVEPEGQTATWIVAIPETYMANIGVTPDDPCPVDLPPIVTVGVEVLGITTGGQELSTPEFFFSIDLCCGCLATCPAESADDEGNLCESTDEPSDMPSCIGQDDLIDCRLCTDPISCLCLFCDPYADVCI